MILIIDTIDKNCVVLLHDRDNIDSRKWQWGKDTGSEVLRNIKKLLEKHKKKLVDIRAILVNCGPGSFTGVRVGVTVANTLGWTLNIPVIGYRDGELEKILSRKITQNKFSKPVLPYY